MKPQYCWRCCKILPMLDEMEFETISALYSEGMRSVIEFRRQHDVPLKDVATSSCFAACLDAYEQITGYREENANAVLHHRLSLYGPPCPTCGKPFRTPSATRCVEQGCPTTTTNH